MARRGRPTVEISVSADERSTLQRWAQHHSSSQALALRSKIVLACAAGDRTHGEIAAALGCHPPTVGKWRHRFIADRLDGLVDAPRPGAARTIGGDVIEAVIVETLDGWHRGLLLPRIDGIESVEAQWLAVHSKAGIKPDTPVRVERFTVTRFGKD